MNEIASSESDCTEHGLIEPKLPIVKVLGLCMVFTALAGLGFTWWSHSKTPKMYESETKFMVQPFSETLMLMDKEYDFPTIPPDQLIPSERLVARAFEDENLYLLDCFEDMGEEQKLEYVISNLELEQDANSRWVFRMRLPDPTDARVVNANIVKTYQKYLEYYRILNVHSESDIRSLQKERDAWFGAWIAYYRSDLDLP